MTRAPQLLLLALSLSLYTGCSDDAPKKDPEFHTSGSAEADQRAGERIAKDQQIRGKGGGAQSEKTDVKKPLYDRVGGDRGLTAIVDDWVDRMISDARVDFARRDVKGGTFSAAPKPWVPDQHNIKIVKLHIVQFLANATGGPTKYEGKTMSDSHKGMRVTNAQFDAAAGDLAASLEKLGYATVEKKELLGIIETTRPQVVTVR